MYLQYWRKIVIFVYMRTIYAILLSIVMAAAMPFAVSASDPGQKVELTVKKGTVKVANASDEAMELKVYAITGALVVNVSDAPGDEAVVELASGYYIVKVADIARRVAL